MTPTLTSRMGASGSGRFSAAVGTTGSEASSVSSPEERRINIATTIAALMHADLKNAISSTLTVVKAIEVCSNLSKKV